MHKTQFLAVLVGGLLMSSVSVLAQDTSAPAAAPAAAPATAPTQPQDDPNEVICKSGEPIVGSRFPGPRTCHTRKEWDQIKQDAQQALYHQQMDRAGASGH
jgi:hypothetical protein